jgi:hypothetical protein
MARLHDPIRCSMGTTPFSPHIDRISWSSTAVERCATKPSSAIVHTPVRVGWRGSPFPSSNSSSKSFLRPSSNKYPPAAARGLGLRVTLKIWPSFWSSHASSGVRPASGGTSLLAGSSCGGLAARFSDVVGGVSVGVGVVVAAGCCGGVGGFGDSWATASWMVAEGSEDGRCCC